MANLPTSHLPKRPPRASLAEELFREVRPDFFRILSGKQAAVYVDVLEVLDIEFSERTEGIARHEVLDIIGEALMRHPDFSPEKEADEVAYADPQAIASREKARWILERLTTSGWLEVQTSTDWQKTVFLDPHAGAVVTLLRKIARPDAAVFTDKLVGVCAALSNHPELALQPYEHIQTCRENIRQGIAELRTMQKSVERFTRRQLESKTLAENLFLVFDQYTEQVGHACYAELVRTQLINRLSDARERVACILDDADLLHKMQAELLRRDPRLTAADAMLKVRIQLDDLRRVLDSISPLADAIDARTAEFTRRSLARFRYLQEVIGERRGQIKDIFEKINTAFKGKRYNDLDEIEGLPLMRLPEARLLSGRDSLYEPPRRRTLEENSPVEEDPGEDLRERARVQMESALRDSLTVYRANTYVTRLPGGKGTRIPSKDLPLHNEDDLADIVALLLHAGSPDANYRLEVLRVETDAEIAEFDRKAGCLIEKFSIIKK